MSMQRRGFLGLLGATTAAIPFLGQAVSLKSDPVTGALSIDTPESHKIVPVAAGQDFLVIPMDRVHTMQPHYRRQKFHITEFDSYPEYPNYPQDLEIDFTIIADTELLTHVQSRVLAYVKKRETIGGSHA
jgi:hypothetical protein